MRPSPTKHIEAQLDRVLAELALLRADINALHRALREREREPALFNRHEAARYLRTSVSTFNRQVRPYVDAVKTGGHPRYRPEDLDRWAAARAKRPALPWER